MLINNQRSLNYRFIFTIKGVPTKIVKKIQVNDHLQKQTKLLKMEYFSPIRHFCYLYS